MRIAVVGAGGTGGYFGGLLARAGQDVTFIARGSNLEAMRARGVLRWSRGLPERSRCRCAPQTTRARSVPWI
jgi:2-dehydropantoate 2-reductase